MPLEADPFLLRNEVPQSHCPIVEALSQGLAGRTQGRGLDRALVSPADEQFLARGNIQQPRETCRTPVGAPLAARGERHRIDGTPYSYEGSSLMIHCRVPQLHRV